jgi:hypoxanthine phosphoribosyltransferase
LEDIVDTGRTLDFLMKTLEIHNPASISIATLLHKPEAMLVPIPLDYVGFEIQNQFVVGYGLDYNGYGRNSSSILIKVDD